MLQNRRNLLRAAVSLPALALASTKLTAQEIGDPETLAANAFNRIAMRTLTALRTADTANIRDSLVESSIAFQQLVQFLTPDHKRDMEAAMRSSSAWAFNRQMFELMKAQNLGFTDDELAALLTPDYSIRDLFLRKFGVVGIEGLLTAVSIELHPNGNRFTKPIRNADEADDGPCGSQGAVVMAAIGAAGAAVGGATFFGCLVCAPVALAFAAASAILNLAKAVACIK